MWSWSVVVTVSKKTCVGNLGLGFFVDLVELDDVANGDVALFKTVEALRRTFFFSTSVGRKTKGAGRGGAGGGGAGREMIDLNTSLPSILTPKHSAICFDKSDFA